MIISSEELKTMLFSHIACIIIDDWKKINYAAQPYVSAMIHLNHCDCSAYHNFDSAESIIRYFLSNARAWRGGVAKLVKSELNRRLKENNKN
jgi:hypothetical protein